MSEVKKALTAKKATVSLGCPKPPNGEKDCEKYLRRLRMLKNMLLHHDELFAPKNIEFDLNDWYYSYPNDCGTAACALGSAMLLKEFQQEGLKPSRNSSNGRFDNTDAEFSAYPVCRISFSPR